MNFIKILIFSAIETIALAAWLGLQNQVLLALAILTAGLTLEHWISYNTAHRRALLATTGLPFGKILLFSIFETGWWAIWLSLAGSLGLAAAALFLSLILIVQHNIEFNVVEGEGFLHKLLSRRSVGISLIEGLGGTAWLVLARRAASFYSLDSLAAVTVLFIVMVVEHIFQAREITFKTAVVPSEGVRRQAAGTFSL